MSARTRTITTNGMLVVAALLAAGLLLEVGTRIYAAWVFPRMMVLDDTLGWRHATDVRKWFQNEFGDSVLVVQDANGHRGTGHALTKPPGAFRILTLGDSFTEGVQVGETDLFTARIENADARLDVINAGVGGYGTVQEYLYLRSLGIRFHPDLVLLMAYENDLIDNLLPYYPAIGPRPYAAVRAGNVELVQSTDHSAFRKFILPLPFATVLNRYSYLYVFVNSRVYQPLRADRMTQLQRGDVKQFDAGTRYRAFFWLLDEMSDFLEGQEIPLVVALIPTRDEILNGYSDVHRVITDHCLIEQLNCVSLVERFHAEASKGIPLLFKEDMHWTAEGHRVTADEILEYLRSTGRIPG